MPNTTQSITMKRQFYDDDRKPPHKHKQHKSKRMRFPTFHRHHGLLSSGNIDASIAKECNNPTNDSSGVLPPTFQYIRETEHDDDHEELISIISRMQQKELDSYNPLQRFEYPLSSNAPLPQDNNDDNNINKKRISVVDDECRSQMLKWCIKVNE